MKVKLQEFKFRGKNIALSELMQAWVDAQDTPVTVRRVFYAMVKDKVMDNTQNGFHAVSRMLTNLRRGGFLDWEKIVDSERDSLKTQDYESAEQCINTALYYFRLDRWKDQKYHMEVWTEKTGAISVLYPTTNGFDVCIKPCKGRTGVTEAHVLNMIEAQNQGKINVIIYLGDYDPTGLRQDENLKKQFANWGLYPVWIRAGLTLEQIRKYNIPRQFAVLDTATESFIKKNPEVEILGYTEAGRPLINKLEKDTNKTWFRNKNNGELFQVEIDALDADTLRALVRTEIMKYLDMEKYNQVLEEEDRQREEMTARILR